MKARTVRRIALGLVLTGVVGFVAVSAFFAYRFTTPPRQPFWTAPEQYLPAYENVSFPARDGVPLSGWFAPATGIKRAVVLLHGNGSTRTQTLARARFFHDRGYAALLYDARGHGTSGGNLVSFGYYETRDLLGALDWLRARGFDELGCVGISQGGATIALAAKDLGHDVRWAILESVYPTLPNAVERRFRMMFKVPAWLAGSLMVPMAEWRLGVNASAISPRDAAVGFSCPVLVMIGDADHHTLPADGHELFDRIRSPKQWVTIPGVAHTDLYGYSKARYERALTEFLEGK